MKRHKDMRRFDFNRIKGIHGRYRPSDIYGNVILRHLEEAGYARIEGAESQKAIRELNIRRKADVNLEDDGPAQNIAVYRREEASPGYMFLFDSKKSDFDGTVKAIGHMRGAYYEETLSSLYGMGNFMGGGIYNAEIIQALQPKMASADAIAAHGNAEGRAARGGQPRLPFQEAK
ncbi:MAG: hypothetical protein HY053_04395 [Proteobacteria bacterium]|nr:hypothetical protein [Pseudomonadota bacterium]